ncbi:hypothetical protein V5799_018334 [Amblyomma americanum]|uniref:Peptidase M13 N-terminal domain-containing protein n=1 Tax=Amblyomma americanum TaxID=6943 RepID=A0AAQ4EZJ8_AMBAM
MPVSKLSPGAIKGISVSPKQKPTLAKVKRRRSLSEATFDVPRNPQTSSDRSSQAQNAARPNCALSGTFVKSAEEEPSSTGGAPGNHKPAAKEDSASSQSSAPRRLEGKRTYSEASTRERRTPSTRSSSSDSSSSARSESVSVSSASHSESQRSECISKALTVKTLKSGASSAATFDVLNSTCPANATPYPSCTETGEPLFTESVNAELPSATIRRLSRLPGFTTPRHSSVKSDDMRDLEARRDPGNFSQPKNWATKIPKKNTDPDAANTRKVRLLSAKTCSSSTSGTSSGDLAEESEAYSPKRNSKFEPTPGRISSLVAVTGDREVAITARRQLKEQSCLKPTFRTQHSAKEDALEGSSLLQQGLASPLKRCHPQELQRKLDATYSVGSEDIARNSNRASISGTAWRNPRTALRTSYNRKTWKRSVGSDRPEEDESVPQERILREHMQRSPLKDCLLYPVAVCLVLGLILVVGFLLLPLDPSGTSKARGLTSSTCVSSSCRLDALHLSSLLSWDSVDPCDDFYSFVCNRWTSQYSVSTPTSYSINFDDDYAIFLENKVYSMIRRTSNESGGLRLIRNLHDKCMSIIRTDDEGWNPLLELLYDVSLEGFPLTPPVRSSKSVWEIAAKVLRKTGAATLLSVGVASHPSRTAGPDLLSVGPPEMLTASGRVETNEVIRLYTEAVFTAIKALKKDYLPPLHALSIVKFASDLEQLGQLVLDGESIPEIQVLKSSPYLLNFFAELLRDVEDIPFSTLSSEVVVESSDLVNSIYSLVHDTDTHTVMNYIGVRLMIEVSPFLPYTDMIDFKSTLLYGRRPSDVSRWQLCVRAVEKALVPLVLVSVLEDVKQHASLAIFSDLSRELFQGFNREIQASAYLDTASKDAVGNLLSMTALRVLGPDWINDEAVVEHHVLSFPSTTNRSSLESYVTNHEYTFLASLKRSSSQRWPRSVFTTNCWSGLSPPTLYVPLLVFNITRIYTGFIDEEQLMRAGPRMARCVFDMVFVLAAAAANSSNQWLSEQSAMGLLRAETCMNTSVERSSHRFRHVRDVLSVQTAYALFQKKFRDKMQALALDEERVLSDRQLFFVNLMMQSCEKTGQQDRAPPKAGRDVAAALRYAQDFSEAYECRLGSAMNAKKCALW